MNFDEYAPPALPTELGWAVRDGPMWRHVPHEEVVVTGADHGPG